MIAKDKIKDIFENTKNLFVCGAVLAAAKYVFLLSRANTNNLIEIQFIGTLLLLFAGILFILNGYHFIHTYFPKVAKGTSTKKQRIIASISALAYTFIAIYIVVSVPGKLQIEKTLTNHFSGLEEARRR